jgi:membrane protease YdiL (CAAX protease family)
MELQVKPINRRPLAPTWHILLLLVLLFVPRSSFLEPATLSSPLVGSGRVRMYALEFCFLWTLFAITYFGLRLNGTKLAAVTGGFRAGRKELLRSTYWGLSYWVFYIFLLLLLVPFGSSGVSSAHLLPRLLPRTAPELALFIVIAISADFCEETIFRGYLFRQLYAVIGNMLV